jgi:hypothetical protein
MEPATDLVEAHASLHHSSMNTNDHAGETLWTLDRIEDEAHAVLISNRGEERVLPRAALPDAAGEGTVLREVEDGWVPDPEATEALRRLAKERRDSLRRGPSGPISL